MENSPFDDLFNLLDIKNSLHETYSYVLRMREYAIIEKEVLKKDAFFKLLTDIRENPLGAPKVQL